MLVRPMPRSSTTATTGPLSLRYPARLAEAGIEPSVGRRGASYDNALAASILGLSTTEGSDNDGPWQSLDHVEYATREWVSWFHTARGLEPLGYVPPAADEAP